MSATKSLRMRERLTHEQVSMRVGADTADTLSRRPGGRFPAGIFGKILPLGNFTDSTRAEINTSTIPPSCLLEHPSCPAPAGQFEAQLLALRAMLSSRASLEHLFATQSIAGTTRPAPGWLVGFPRTALTSPRGCRRERGALSA